MQDETKHRWEELCKQAVTEKDPEKFLALIREINDQLEARRKRLSNRKALRAAG